jgi:hypothetical protein
LSAVRGAVDVFDGIRERCAEVMRRARFVRIDPVRIDALASELAAQPPPAPTLDPRHHHFGPPESTLAFLLTLDSINFGSGWFPVLRKRPGLSGYFTIATALKERFDNLGSWSAAELCELDAGDLARVLGQDLDAKDVAELMTLFARALRDLGGFLIERYEGCPSFATCPRTTSSRCPSTSGRRSCAPTSSWRSGAAAGSASTTSIG